jgi:acetyl esterase/lipase
MTTDPLRCGYIQGQNNHSQDYNGDLPDDMVTRQTNDIKAFVVALRNSGLVNPNKIGVLGGSSGATHAIWVALDTTDTGSNWPFWNAAARPQCAVMLSAAYDFSDLTPPNGQSEIGENFILWTQNYVNSADLVTLKAKSPVSVATAPTQNAPFVPLYMINSWFDPVAPWHQIVDMICKLRSVGVPDSAYQTLTVPNSDAHSFALWAHWDGISDPHKKVRDDVIDFLNAHLR